jgi:hypothetical protein
VLAWPSNDFGRAGPCHRTPTVRSGMAGASSSVMGPRRGLHGEHGEGSRVALGKVAEGGAHLVRPSTVRWREGASAAVLDDGNRAPVARDDRRRALEHRDRKGSNMHDQIEDREGRLLELTREAEVATAAASVAL